MTTLTTPSSMPQSRVTWCHMSPCPSSTYPRGRSCPGSRERGGMMGSWLWWAVAGHWLSTEGGAHPALPERETRGTRGHLERVTRSRGLLLSTGKGEGIASASCGLGGNLLFVWWGSGPQGKIHPGSSSGRLWGSKQAWHLLHPIPSLLPAAPVPEGSIQSMPDVLWHQPLSCLSPLGPAPAPSCGISEGHPQHPRVRRQLPSCS